MKIAGRMRGVPRGGDEGTTLRLILHGSGWHPLFVKESSLPRDHAIHFHVTESECITCRKNTCRDTPQRRMNNDEQLQKG